MRKLPATISHPLIKDKVTFLQTHADTNGAYTLFEVELAPGGGNSLHFHTTYTEEFEVLEGILGVQIVKDHLYLKPGEKYLVSLHVKHRFFNDGDARVKFLTTVRPARQFEQALRIIYGLASDGLVSKKGFPHFLYMAIFLKKSESYLPGISYRIQQAIFSLLASIAWMMGMHKKLYKYYR